MFRTLIRLQMRSYFAMFQRDGSGKQRTRGAKIGMALLMVVLYLYIAGVVLFSMTALFSSLVKPMHLAGEDGAYFGLGILIAMLIGLLMSMFAFRSQLFEAKDNELLLSLPIRPSTILLARLAVLGVTTLFYMLLALVPVLGVYAVFVGCTVQLVVTFLLTAVISVLLVMTLGSLLGWLLAWIASKTKNKSFINILLSVIFLVAYFYFYTNMQTAISGIVQNPYPLIATMKSALVPFYWIGSAAAGSWLLLGACAAVAAVAFGIVLLGISRSFLKLATPGTAAGPASAAGKRRAQTVVVSSVRSALLKKELTRIFGNANYFMNCCMGGVLLLIGAVAAVWRRELLLGMTASMPAGFGAVIAAVLIPFVLSMCDTAAPSIALEGKFFPQLRALPLSFSQIAFAKITANVCIGTLPALAASAAFGYALQLPLLQIVLVFIASFFSLCFTACWGLLCALWMPRLDFPSEIHAIKQSGAVGLGLMGGMAIMLIPMVGGIIGAFALQATPVLALLCVCYAVIFGISVLLLHKTGDRLFNRIG